MHVGIFIKISNLHTKNFYEGALKLSGQVRSGQVRSGQHIARNTLR